MPSSARPLHGFTDVWRAFAIDPEVQHVIATPVVEGAVQRQEYSDWDIWTWHQVGTVNVEAGTFEDCWKADSGAYVETWCRGVGMIDRDYDSGWASIELAGTNFIPWSPPPVGYIDP